MSRVNDTHHLTFWRRAFKKSEKNAYDFIPFCFVASRLLISLFGTDTEGLLASLNMNENSTRMDSVWPDPSNGQRAPDC